ncbi:MAG: serine/threonine protein kinase [Deltaproteobacteria bacterium]|nr:serine/threonine protein kinase [Deltaproteobacteria bacterium]
MGRELERRAQVRVGTILKDAWRLDALLGVGAMAAVYAATAPDGSRAAIKLLHPELSSLDELRARFLREAYVANRIEHAGAVRVLSHGEDKDGVVFLVMDLLEGETAHARWRRSGNRLEVALVLHIADAVLGVLVAAHDQGIYHRDIKPKNIFLTDDGSVKLLDFGIARITDAATALTQTGVLIGTLPFMSPEQARGQVHSYGPSSDLWALGAVMFTFLSGRFVHEADTPNERLLAAMTRAAPPLGALLPGVPEDLARLVDTALAFDRDRRWQQGREMLAALRAVRAALAESPAPSAPPAPPCRPESA